MNAAGRNTIFIWIWMALFVATRLPYLSYPWFWDESWSYIPGVIHMKNNGPTLLPHLTDAVFTRGHPLLFYFISACWMKCFGGAFVSMHILSLAISCSTIFAVHYISRKLWNNELAMLATVLATTQVMFMVQATLVLPEMLVALLALLCLYYYSTKQYIYTTLALTALLFTKESGLVLGLILGMHACIALFNKQLTLKNRLMQIASVALPGLLIAGFFILQRHNNGWYLFPEHTALIQHGWLIFKGKMRFCFEVIFTGQGRLIVFGTLMALGIAAAVKTRKWFYLMPALITVPAYIFINEQFGYLSRKAMLPALFALMLFTIHQLAKRKDKEPAQQFLFLSGLYFAGYLCFSSLNFFTTRYLLSPLLVLLIITAWLLYTAVTNFAGKKLVYVLTIVMLANSVYTYINNKGIRDVDTGAYSAVRLQKNMAKYMEEQKLHEAAIYCPSGLDIVHLTDPNTGYISKSSNFRHVTGTLDNTTEYILIDNVEFDSLHVNRIVPPNFKLIYSDQQREAWGMIFKKTIQ